MAKAGREQYRAWVVDALRALGRTSPKAVYAWIRSNCPVPAEDRATTTADGECLFEKEVRFARWELRRAGEINGRTRGVWDLMR